MDALFQCPPPAALATVPTQACPERFDQIVRFAIQRKQAVSSFTTTSLLLQATWTPLIAETDSTKVILTPLIPNVVIPAGEVLKEGGNDNTTINGIPKLAGLPFVPVTAQLQDANSAVRQALKALASESAVFPGFTNLWIYPINRFGQIIGVKDGTDVKGIPAYNFIVGDVGTEGLNKANIANLSFDLAPGWSDGVEVFNPSFDPLAL
jgi:hypothetical protein